jgi:hypothetical protein
VLLSSVCRYEDFLSDWYLKWMTRLNPGRAGLDPAEPGSMVQRKDWEWCAIAQALEERGMLEPGKSGCGFAVGTEPLASAFAARGARILATDQPAENGTSRWVAGNQHAVSLQAVHHPEIIGRSEFDEKVSFQPVDMRHLALPWSETYDFVWSSCSLEHLGSLEAGMNFVLDVMKLVKPGGISVHTTEFNVSSNTTTLELGPNVIYRRQDLERLDTRLRAQSCGMSRLDLYCGDHQYDIEFDYPPYFTHGRQHVKLALEGHVATSVLMIIRKGQPANCELVSPL